MSPRNNFRQKQAPLFRSVRLRCGESRGGRLFSWSSSLTEVLHHIYHLNRKKRSQAKRKCSPMKRTPRVDRFYDSPPPTQNQRFSFKKTFRWCSVEGRGLNEKHIFTCFLVCEGLSTDDVGRWQCALYFRRHGYELVSKPAISLKKRWRGATVENDSVPVPGMYAKQYLL